MSDVDANPDSKLRFRRNGEVQILELGEKSISPTSRVYRDTPASELQGMIAKIDSGQPWRQAVSTRFATANPWLHRIVTDPTRDLFFRIHPPRAGSRVLDVGSGWGQMALPLARSTFVCALEPTPERLDFIRAAAVQDGVAKRMWFLQADVFDIEFETTFDVIACIGVLEWIPKFQTGLEPRVAQERFLARLHRALAPGGQLVIGIENRLGLKYLLGAADDHLGIPAVAVYDLTLANRKHRALRGEPLRTLIHTRAELDEMLAGAGFAHRRFYSAFPDYKLPQRIIPWGKSTDQFLLSDFVPEHEGITGTPLAFQAELQSHYRSLAALGIASDFAPSFYVVAQHGAEA